MKVIVDTNILLRAAIQDDEQQAKHALAALRSATQIIIPIVVLCEFVWVVRRGYRRTTAETVAAIRELVEADNVVVDRNAVDAGLKMLEAGGDFADGVVAFDGRRMGGDVFVTFDGKAARLLVANGDEVRLLDPGQPLPETPSRSAPKRSRKTR